MHQILKIKKLITFQFTYLVFLQLFSFILYFLFYMKNQIILGVKTNRILSGYNSPKYYEIGPATALIFDGHKTIHLLNVTTNSISKKVNLGEFGCKFVSLTHSIYYQSIFILSEDWNLVIFDLEMNYLLTLNLGFKYVLELYFIDSCKTFLLSQPNILTAVQVQINTNSNKAKFISSMSYSIKEINSRKLKSLSYVKNIKFEQNTYVVLNNLTDVSAYYIYNLSIALQLKQLTQKQNQLQCLIICIKKLYLIIGLAHGNIKIYKLSNQKYCLHELQSHSKRVLDFQINKNQELLFSASEDESIRIFSLQSMQLLLNFKTNQRYHIFKFYTERSFLACEEDTTIIGSINTKHELFHRHNSKVQNLQISNQRILVSLSDNSVLAIFDGSRVSTTFTPPSSKHVIQIQLNPYSGGNQYWLLIDTKQIYTYNVDEHRIKQFEIRQIYPIQNFINILNQECTFEIVNLKFINKVPIKYDSEIKENIYIQNKKSVYEFKPIAFGCKKGQILIFSMNDLEQIQTKLNFHKAQIMLIDEIRSGTDYFLLSAAKDNQLLVINISGKVIPSVILSFDLTEAFCKIYIYDELLFISFKSGPYQILEFKNKNLISNTTISNNQHQDQITFLSYYNPKSIVCTSSKDCRIKIWNLKKQMLFEVVANSLIQCVVFLADKILYSTDGTLLMIKISKYIKYLNNKDYEQKQYVQRSLSEILKQYNHKKNNFPKIQKNRSITTSVNNQSDYELKSIVRFNKQKTKFSSPKQKSISVKKHDYYHNKSSGLEGYDYLFHFPNENILAQITGKSKY